MGIFQLPKDLHPDFYRKGKKPTAPVTLDRSNKFGRHLFAGYLPGDSTHTLRDLTGRFDGAVGDPSAYSIAPLKKGLALDGTATSTSDLIDFDSAEFRALFDGSKPFTLFFHGSCNDQDPDSAYFGIEGTDDFVFYLSEGFARECRVFWRDVGANVVTKNRNTVADDEVVTIAYTFDGADQHKLFIDGVEVDSATQIGSGAGPYSTGPTLYGWDGGQHTTAKTLGFFVFNRDLSSQMRELSRDPYQILKPATPQLYFVPAGVGGNTIEVDCSFSIASDFSTTKTATIEASADYAITSDVNSGKIADVNANTTFNISTNYANDNVISANASLDYDVTHLISAISDISAEANIAENVGHGFDVTKDAIFETALAFDVIDSVTLSNDATKDVDLDFSISSGFDSSSVVSIEAALASGISSSFSTSNTVDSEASIDIGLSSDFVNQATATINANLSENVTNSYECASNLVTSASASYAISSAASLIGGKSIEASTVSSIVNDVSLLGKREAEASIVEGVISDTIAQSVAVINASIQQGITSEITITNTATLEAGIVVNLTTTYSADGLKISGSIITPEGRTINILVSNRNIEIKFCNRTIEIKE